MNIFIYVIMLMAGGGMIYGIIQQRRGAVWGHKLAVLSAVVALMMTMWTVLRGGGSKIDAKEIRKREAAFERIAVERLGQYLAENHAGANALVIKPIAFGGMRETLEAQVAGLLNGLGDAVSVVEVVTPKLPQEFIEMMDRAGTKVDVMEMPPMTDVSLYQAERFNALVRDYSDKVDIVISLAGLPSDMQNLYIWRANTPPKLAVYGSPYMPGVLEAIEQGFIVAYVTYRLDADPETYRIMPKGVEDFDSRYHLITPHTVGAMDADHPMRLFR